MGRKKKQTRTIQISAKEEGFIQDLLGGADLLVAYRNNWDNSYNDAKAVYEAKQILDRDRVKERMSALLADRQEKMVLDESFVVDKLKSLVMDGSTSSASKIRALELLGKKMGMWIEKQIIEENTTHRELADEIYQRREAIERGETVKPINEVEEHETEIVEFTIKDGTNGD